MSNSAAALNTDTASVYTDFDGLAKLKNNAKDQSPEALQQVAKQFESVFLNMMLKNMRQAKLADGIMDNQQSAFYQDMYDQQLSLELAKKSGFGIAEFIVKQLSPKTNKNDKQTEAEDNSDSSGFPVSFSSESKTKAITGVNPLSSNPIAASGLTSLERSLSELLNSSSKTDLLQWQNQDDEWQTAKLTLTNKDEINSKQDFIDQLQPLAEQAAKALGVDANLLLAQAALETGWGQAVLKNTQGVSSYNLFNIKADKAWQGNQTKTSTIEFDGGIAKKETASFRAYQSFQESFIDYVDFIKSNPRYSEALKKAANAYQYITALQQAGYATDPKYAEKIFSIYQAQIGNNAKSNHVSG